MPNRYLKETICTSDTLDVLSADEERFFYRLMVQVDDFGRTDARPQVLRAKCFPLKVDDLTNAKILRWLNALSKAELVLLYEVDDKPYLEFVTWGKHQRKRAKDSKYPPPSAENSTRCQMPASCGQPLADDNKCGPITTTISLSNNDYDIDIDNDYGNDYGKKNDDEFKPPLPDELINLGLCNLVKTFEQEFGRPLSPIESEKIQDLGKFHGTDLAKEALEIAVVSGKVTLRYTEGILQNWFKANLKTIREVKEYESKHKANKTHDSPKTKGVNSHGIHRGRDPDDDYEDKFYSTPLE